MFRGRPLVLLLIVLLYLALVGACVVGVAWLLPLPLWLGCLLVGGVVWIWLD